jgi:hypothetical protein
MPRSSQIGENRYLAQSLFANPSTMVIDIRQYLGCGGDGKWEHKCFVPGTVLASSHLCTRTLLHAAGSQHHVSVL